MSPTVKELNDAREIQLRSDISDLAKTPAGVRFFKWVIDKGQIFQHTFTGNSECHFLEGRKSFALDILDVLFDVAPEKVPEIILEDKEMTQAQREENEKEEELYP